jgi:hypothetical protein
MNIVKNENHNIALGTTFGIFVLTFNKLKELNICFNINFHFHAIYKSIQVIIFHFRNL